MTAQKISRKYSVLSIKISVLIALLFFAFYLLPNTYHLIHAQNFDIASTYELTDEEAATGDILTSDNNGISRSKISYDNHLFGVLADGALLIYTEATASGRPVARSGDVEVNVSDLNGEITPGDHITSSSIPGIGMKATQSGYTIGIAISDFTPIGTTSLNNTTYRSGTVRVALKIEYSELTSARNTNRLMEILGLAFFRNIQDPEKFTQVVKAIISGLIAIISFIVGFFAFMRAIAKGVEAIGRNPLAKSAIQFSIMLQLILTVFTTLAGLGAAFLVLRL